MSTMSTEQPTTRPAIWASTCWTCGRIIQQGEPLTHLRHGYRAPDGTRRSIDVHAACGLPASPTPPVPVHKQQEALASTPPTQPTQQPTRTTTTQPEAPNTTPNGSHGPTPSAQDALDALARALSQRRSFAPQIDPAQVQAIAEQAAADATAPLASHLVSLAQAAAELAQRLANIETQPQPEAPKIDPAELERLARIAAAQEARAAVQDAQASGAVALTVVGEVPPVDPLYHDASDTSADIRALIERNSHVLVSGPSGSGKTFPALQECARLGRRAVLVSCADGITYSALVARPSQTTPSLEYRYGPLPLAMRAGAVLVLDEIDKLDPLLAAVFHGPLEPDSRRRTLHVPETGETIVAAPGFLVIATCNGLRDESGSYAAHRIDGAFLTRCRGVAADYLPLADEQALFERAGLDTRRAELLAKTLIGLRTVHTRGDFSLPPSTRLGVQWLRMVLGRHDDGSAGAAPIAPARAWRLSCLSLVTPAQAQLAAGIIQPDAATWTTEGGAT